MFPSANHNFTRGNFPLVRAVNGLSDPKSDQWENAQKIGAAGDSNPGPRGFVVFRAALVTARTDGKTLTWVGKERIESETVKFVKK